MCTLSYWSGVQNVLASIIVQSIWKHGWRVWGTSTQVVENLIVTTSGEKSSKVLLTMDNKEFFKTKWKFSSTTSCKAYWIRSTTCSPAFIYRNLFSTVHCHVHRAWAAQKHPGPKRTDKDWESGGDAHMLQRIWKREYCNPWNILKRYIFIFPCSQLTSLRQKILERRFVGGKKEEWWKPCQDPLKVIFDLHIHKATKTSFCWVLFSRSHVPNTHTAHTFLDTFSVISSLLSMKKQDTVHKASLPVMIISSMQNGTTFNINNY